MGYDCCAKRLRCHSRHLHACVFVRTTSFPREASEEQDMITILLQDPRLPPDTVAIIAESDWVIEFSDLYEYFGEATQAAADPAVARTREYVQSKDTRPMDWSQRVNADRPKPSSAYQTNEILSDLVRACNLAMKVGHGDLIFVSAEYNNRRAHYPSNGTQAVAVTTRCAGALHHLLCGKKPWHIDKLLMGIGVKNELPSPFSSSAVYKPYGNSSTHESGCSMGKDKHWTGEERPGNWGAKYIAMTYRDEDRWLIKPSTAGKATYLARLRFPEDNEGAVWRTLCDNEGDLPGFARHLGDSGLMEVNPEVQTANMKRKRRRMQHKSTFRVYTLDPNEAVMGARHTGTRLLYWIRTHEII
jgi:hypothetical protein